MNVRAQAAGRPLQPDVRSQRAGGNSWAVAVDLVRLSKPRITVMVALTALGGMWLASRLTAVKLTWGPSLASLVGVVLVVGSANALNMLWERHTDGLMSRTKNRPLPAGRLSAGSALAVGLGQAVIGLPLLAYAAGWLTTALAAGSLVTYVAVYTPLKQVTPLALLVGAVPGAMPPLLGWTAATGSIGLGGLALFFVLFFWQIPHFGAIASFRADEYARAGIKVWPAVRGELATRRQAVWYCVALLAASLTLVPLGVAGIGYLVAALGLGGMYLLASLQPVRAEQGPAGHVRWAKRVFFASLIYLPLLFAALMVGL